MPTFVATPQIIDPTDPNFPTPPGYSVNGFVQTIDFGLGWFYEPAFQSPTGGVIVTDISTMAVIKTATLDEMYLGTSFGHPAGSPPSQTIFDLAAGSSTNLYMLMDNGISGIAGEFCRFTRVDPSTLKVTGEFYVSNSFPAPLTCVVGKYGVVSTTTTNEIVAYWSNPGLDLGPQIFDGNNMQPVGVVDNGPTYGSSENVLAVITGKKLGDGSCDFLMLNSDPTFEGGIVDIWRINVKNLAIPPAWQASHAYALNAIVKGTMLNAPFFQVTTAGTSDTTQPMWNTTVGGFTTDGTVTWEAISVLAFTSTKTGTVQVLSWVAPVWQSTHAYSLGAIVKSSTADTSFRVTTAGRSGSTEPIWNLTGGSTTTDGTVVWTSLAPPIWQSLHAYSLNDIRSSTAGSSFKVTVAGTSGFAEPIWNTTPGTDTTDGSVTWIALGGGVLAPAPDLYISQSNYDAANDCIILWLSTTSATEGPPVFLVSVNYDGSVNWVTYLPDLGLLFSKGQSVLSGTTLMVGGGLDLKVINTTTGAVEFTGAVASLTGSFYRIYNAATLSYFTYGLSTSGFTRINFFGVVQRAFVMRPSR